MAKSTHKRNRQVQNNQSNNKKKRERRKNWDRTEQIRSNCWNAGFFGRYTQTLALSHLLCCTQRNTGHFNNHISWCWAIFLSNIVNISPIKSNYCFDNIQYSFMVFSFLFFLVSSHYDWKGLVVVVLFFSFSFSFIPFYFSLALKCI